MFVPEQTLWTQIRLVLFSVFAILIAIYLMVNQLNPSVIGSLANSADPDQMPHVASDQGLQCLLIGFPT